MTTRGILLRTQVGLDQEGPECYLRGLRGIIAGSEGVPRGFRGGSEGVPRGFRGGCLDYTGQNDNGMMIGWKNNDETEK